MLFDVTILVTTFLRDGYLLDCLSGIQANLPECTIAAVDDSHRNETKDAVYWALNLTGHSAFDLPFDSGLPAKRNAGARISQTKYVLLGCDDFDFWDIEAMQRKTGASCCLAAVISRCPSPG